MIYDVLTELKIPVAYSHFKQDVKTPFIVYRGNGQTTFGGDNTWIYRNNQYIIEYYFTIKDEELEDEIEELLLENGYNYEKSEDTFIDSEEVFVIYYFV